MRKIIASLTMRKCEISAACIVYMYIIVLASNV